MSMTECTSLRNVYKLVYTAFINPNENSNLFKYDTFDNVGVIALLAVTTNAQHITC